MWCKNCKQITCDCKQYKKVEPIMKLTPLKNEVEFALAEINTVNGSEIMGCDSRFYYPSNTPMYQQAVRDLNYYIHTVNKRNGW